MTICLGRLLRHLLRAVGAIMVEEPVGPPVSGEEHRATLRRRFAQRTMDADGLDWQTLARIDHTWSYHDTEPWIAEEGW